MQIGCVSLDEQQVEDMISTLIFAYKASSIVNTVVRAEEQGCGVIESLRRRVKNLELELSRANMQIESLSSMLDKQAMISDSVRATRRDIDDMNSTHVLNSLYERIEDIRVKSEESNSSQPHKMGINIANYSQSGVF
jgi:uncharacterized coiled-coil protein SlyX